MATKAATASSSPVVTGAAAAAAAAATGSPVVAAPGEYVDLHELAKGWKAAIERAKNPATRYDQQGSHNPKDFCQCFVCGVGYLILHTVSSNLFLIDTKPKSRMIVVIYPFIRLLPFEHRSKSPKPYSKPTPRPLP